MVSAEQGLIFKENWSRPEKVCQFWWMEMTSMSSASNSSQGTRSIVKTGLSLPASLTLIVGVVAGSLYFRLPNSTDSGQLGA
jgi:hypothetical protein